MNFNKFSKGILLAIILSKVAIADINGVVFRDLPVNGTTANKYGVKDTNEFGVAGVTVTGIDSSGATATTQSAQDGSYTLTGLSGKVRVEFSNWASYLKESPSNTVNNSSVRFVNDGDSNIDFGLHNPIDYNPGLDKTVFAVSTQRPWASATQKSNKNYGLISLPYNATGQANPAPSQDVSFDKIGTVWGAAYQRSSGLLYEAAFLKRHSGLGELVRPNVGTGEQDVPVDGIYRVEYNGTIGGAYIGGFTLNGVTPANGDAGVINTGTVRREIMSGAIGTARPNALTTSTQNNRSYDVDAFAKVGKVGFGDADIDETDKALWVVNLNQKSLIKIDISNPDTLPTNGSIDGSLISHYNIDFSSLGTCNGEFRPWALAFYNKKGYVGVICDSTGDTTNNSVHAYILSFNPNNPTGTFEEVKDFPLTYTRESSQYSPSYGTCALGSQSNWNRWANSWSELGGALGKNAKNSDDKTYGAERACPQPILSDITFDSNNGDIILGFIDRFAQQLDRVNYPADTSIGKKYFSVDSAGDTLHLCKTDNGYLLEGESGCNISHDNNSQKLKDEPTNRAKSNDGPGGVGEFYYKDYSAEYDNGKKAHHIENNLGSVISLAGSSQVIVTAYDAIIGTFNQGFLWYNTNSVDSNQGNRVNQYQISQEGANDLNTKGSGLGDIEFIVPPAPTEVGNRVWKDDNADGIQDANEVGISGVKVDLICGGNQVAEVTTDANGYYIFSNDPNGSDTDSQKYNIKELKADSDNCVITIPNATGASQQSSLTKLKPTLVKSGTDSTIDSDGVLNGDSDDIQIQKTDIPSIGANNHSLDFGFKQADTCIGDFVWIDKNVNGLQDSDEVGVSGINVTLKKDGQDFNTTTTDSNGKYQFCGLKAGTYQVVFDLTTLPEHYTVTIQDAGNDDSKDSDADPSTGESAQVTIQNDGDPDILTVDMGIYKKPCLGDFVWLDKNGNGIQDSDEAGIDGVTVELLDASGAKINGGTTTETNTTNGKSGYYEFCDLDIDTEYKVLFDINDSYKISPANQGSDDANDSDADESSKEAVATIAKDDNMTIDAGIYKPACIGDFVWYDKNKNGLQDANESGVDDVNVTLIDSDGNRLDSNTTQNGGKYEFCGLKPGDYKVKFELPDGYEGFTEANRGDGTNDSDVDSNGEVANYVTLESGDNYKDLDAGLIKPPSAIDIEKFTKDREGNYQQADGADDNDVPTLIEKHRVTWKYVVTNSGGQDLTNVAISDDKAGSVTNCVDEANNTVSMPTSLASGKSITCYKDGVVQDASLGEYENNATVTAKDTDNESVEDSDLSHYNVVAPACIGDRIWLDSNANGIQDSGESNLNESVTITLLDSNDNNVTDANDTAVAPIVTTNGKYEFCNLVPGDYKVKFKLPDGYYISPKDKSGSADDEDNNTNDDSDINPDSNETVAVHLDSGEKDLTWDVGVYKPACIGNLVWEDKNANGLQEPGESGVAGAVVTLLDENASKVTTNLKGESIEPITTQSDGKYEFCNLKPNKYIIEVTPPSNYLLTYQDKSGSAEDVANNTDDDSDINTTTHKSVVVELSSDENDTSWDAGVFKPACLGDYTWLDENVDGIQTDGEKALNGVNVTILDANANPVTVGADGSEYNSTQVTGEVDGEGDGKYHFCNLRPGTYMVKFKKEPDSSGAPFISTVKDSGSDSEDSDVAQYTDAKNGLISDPATIESGEDNRTIDAGFIQELCLGDRVWEDRNANGIQEDGEEPLANVTVNLMMDNGNGWEAAKDVKGNPIDTNSTDANGNYKFCHLKPAIDYKITFTKPTGYYVTDKDVDNNSKDSNDSDIDENSEIIVKKPVVDDMSLDAGFFRPACIGNYVWEDRNANGIQDADESGLDGVKVELLENNSTDITNVDGEKVTPLTTANGGKYHFECKLKPGKYSLRFTTPDGYYYTRKDTTADSNDSDVIEQFKAKVGTTPVTELVSGEDDLTWDAGVFKPACIGNFIWDDKNANGVQDAGEETLKDDNNNTIPVKVTLIPKEDVYGNIYNKDLDGNTLGSVNTDEMGKYRFCQLVPGDYQVKVTVPNNYVVTRDNIGSDSNDSDLGSFLDTGDVTMPKETLSSGEDNDTLDGGVFKPSCLGSTIWFDKNGNGIKDADEDGIADVNVTLIPVEDEFGNKNNQTAYKKPYEMITTKDDGKYEFCNLIPGKYRVKFEAPLKDGAPLITTKRDSGDDTKDSDTPEYERGVVYSDVVTLGSRVNNTTVFAGYIQKICLGDKVWYDKNLNGIQDSKEPGVVDLKVYLTYADGSVVTDVYGNRVTVTKTDKNGNYKFCNLYPAKDYKIKFDIPKGYHPTLQNKESDIVDSDAMKDGSIIVKSPVVDDYTQDLGIYCDCDDYKVNPQNHKELKASALNIFTLLTMFSSLFLLARRED